MAYEYKHISVKKQVAGVEHLIVKVGLKGKLPNRTDTVVIENDLFISSEHRQNTNVTNPQKDAKVNDKERNHNDFEILRSALCSSYPK